MVSASSAGETVGSAGAGSGSAGWSGSPESLSKSSSRDWERDGQKHYTTEIVAHQMQMLGERKNQGQ